MANNAGQFEAGKSGNPGGRPKSEKKVLALAQSLSPEAIEKLAAIMRGGYGADVSARIRAAQIILERAYGKPRQAVDLASKNGGLKALRQKTIDFQA